MIYFTINEKNYSAIETWAEMTLAKGVDLSSLARLAPQKLQDYYTIVTGTADKEEKEKELNGWIEAVGEDSGDLLIKLFPDFYGKVICLLSDVPEDVMKYVNAGSRHAVYKQFFESFVIGILHEPFDYKPQGIQSFKYKDTEYFLPVTRNIIGNERPMADRSAIEFTESADLQIASRQMTAGKFHFCANIVAILCRPMQPINPKSLPELTPANAKKFNSMQRTELEPYDEETCLKRAELFRGITMDIVFEVFFCLAQHILLFYQHTQISSLEVVVEQQKKRQGVAD